MGGGGGGGGIMLAAFVFITNLETSKNKTNKMCQLQNVEPWKDCA